MKSIFELKIEEMPDGDLDATIVIDGVPFGSDCIDLGELRQSALVSGAYDLQTCGCGMPQCAGFWEPIFVQHDGDAIRWEFDNRYHPVPIKEEEEGGTEQVIGRYEFDRHQYIKEIHEKFAWLSAQPNRSSVGPYGLNPDILDAAFPDPSLPSRPFAEGARLVVGYMTNFHQPWVWIDNDPDVLPRQLLPTGAMWSQFGDWSLMWGSQHYDLGPCMYRRDAGNFNLLSTVTIAECNQAVQTLSHAVQQFWGPSANVFWDRMEDGAQPRVVRAPISAMGGAQSPLR